MWPSAHIIIQLYMWIVMLFSQGSALRIITVIVGDNPSSGIQLTGPAFDVAFADASEKYGGIFDKITRMTVYRPGALSCAGATDNIADVLGNSSKLITAISDEPTILFSAGCSSEALVFGDFAREWDIPLFASMAGDAAFSNRLRYPTTLVMGPADHASSALATHAFIDYFRWRTVSLICDRLSRNLASTGFSSFSCTTIQKRLRNGSGRYTVHIHDFDPAQDNSTFSSILELAKAQSRIILIYADLAVVRTFLVLAERLGMTQGEYVFLTTQGLLTKISQERIWRKNDVYDEIALSAMKSLIVMNNQAANWSNVASIVGKMGAVAREKYNYTQRKGEVNDLTMSSYETASAFAEIYQEMLNLTTEMDGRGFVQSFYNRSFTFDSRGFLINDRGIRTVDSNFWRLDSLSLTAELAWKYCVKCQSLQEASHRLATAWPGNGSVPRDVPRCGFLNDKCIIESSYLLHVGIGTGVLLGTGLILFTLLLKMLSMRALRSLADWYLYPSTFSLTPLRNAHNITEITLDDWTKHCIDHIYVHEKHEILWVERLQTALTETQMSSQRRTVDVLLQIRSISHGNIQKFRGLYLDNEAALLIWNFGARGILRSLIDSDRIAFSHDIRGSICWDLINATQYLKKSRLGFHGSLCSLNCMIDKRFSIQLAATGTSKLYSTIFGGCGTYHWQLHKFWLAPEILAKQHIPGSSAGDVFSLGVVIAEVISGKTPMDINFKDPLSFKEKSAALLVTVQSDEPHERIGMNVGAVTVPAIRSLLFSMMHHNPSDRPTTEQVMRVFGKTYPRTNVITSLIRRLENFTGELEELVLARTEELWDETVKVDHLLAEIVPRSLIAKLRNKTEIMPEMFDSISLLFSALPEFPDFCVAATPKDVIHLLHDVYISFDCLLESFDVYKVETIKDSYMVVSGLPVRNGTGHIGHIVNLALALMEIKKHRGVRRSQGGLSLRIGIHTGPCAAGVVGQKMPRYCLFGDTVNIASRMETTGLANRIHVSSNVRKLVDEIQLDHRDVFTSRGVINIKGKGLCETFWLTRTDSVDSEFSSTDSAFKN